MPRSSARTPPTQPPAPFDWSTLTQYKQEKRFLDHYPEDFRTFWSPRDDVHGMLSALLDYPDEPLVEALAEIRTSMERHRAFAPATREALIALVDQLASRPLLDLQEDYVETFDRGRAMSLYLFRDETWSWSNRSTIGPYPSSRHSGRRCARPSIW